MNEFGTTPKFWDHSDLKENESSEPNHQIYGDVR